MPHWTSALGLVGRDRELAALREFVDNARADGGALVVVGEAGVGKTALLEAVAAAAAVTGTRILRASGVEFEAEVSFAGLHQLLSPIAPQLAGLRPDFRHAISVSLGMEDGVAADRLALANAVLALLAQSAASAPILMVVDDLQWLDHASAVLFATLARRLSGTGIGLIGVVREGEGSIFEDAALPELALESLDESASTTLLAGMFPELGRHATQQVLIEAQGNPLALIELPAATVPSEPGHTIARTPVGRRLRLYFARLIDALPAAARDQLLLAALDGTGDPFQDLPAGDLEPAERAGLIRVHPISHGVQFRHPLTRSAVVELSTDEQRRAAHRRLADRYANDQDRRVWHLAAATSEPDEAIARLLEDAAMRTKGRGDPVGAIGMLLRAADLSPGPADYQRRAMFASYLGVDVTGELTDPRRAGATGVPGQGQTIAAAVAAAAYMVNSGGDIDTIHRILVGALHTVRGPIAAWDEPLVEIVYVLQSNCSFGSRADLVHDYRAMLDQVGLEPPEILALLGDTFLEPVTRAKPALARLDDAIAGIAEEFDHAHAVRLGIAGMYVDRLAGCRDALTRIVEHGRAGGAVASAIKAFVLLGFDALLTGDWDEAQRLAGEGLTFTDRHHYRLLGGFLQYDLAMIAAARGDAATAQRIADELIGWAAPNRVGFALQLAAHAKALASLSSGAFDVAYRQVVEVCSPGTIPSHKPAALWMLFDLVEAAVRAGRARDAAAHVAELRASGIADISPRLALVVSGATALIAAEADYDEAFKHALTTPDASRWPFLLARIRLAYGERLRRGKAPTDARIQLEEARDAFQRLGAEPWAVRARTELRATGLGAPERVAGALTPQQREIAELAAAGLSNKQIGERLFLSPRTVGAHLYQIFPKLGITSRAALRDALRDEEGVQTPGAHA